MLQVGDKAPALSLYNTDKELINIPNNDAKTTLLLFFPQAFTSVCTAELCGIRDNIAKFNNVNSVVFGISVDSVFSLGKFKEAEGYNFPLLSDFNKEASAAYDCLYSDWILNMKGVSKRSAFIIDKNGIIQYAEVLENAGDVPSFDDINKKLAELA